MLRFFRHIRKSLMEQDNVRKYLLYAVGEIALVMIGILLALQVNNWNEQRKLLQEERGVLISLQTEINQAIDFMEVRIKDERNVTGQLKILLTEGPDKEALLEHPKVDSLLRISIWQSAGGVPVLQTYNDLKSAGEISLIQNRDIRNRLAEVEDGLNVLDVTFSDIWTIQQTRIDEIAINKMNLKRVLQATRFPTITPGPPNNYKVLFEDTLVLNALAAKMELIENALNHRIEMMDACKQLTELISQELGGKL